MFFEWLIDPKFLSGFGVGFLTSAYFMLFVLKNGDSSNGQLSKMKLSSKQMPSSSELKKVYQKDGNKAKVKKLSSLEMIEHSQIKRQDDQNTKITQVGKKTFLQKQQNNYVEEDEIRKKVKMQYHQFDPLFDENPAQQSLSDFESLGSSRSNHSNAENFSDALRFEQQQQQQQQKNDADLDEIIDIPESKDEHNQFSRERVNIQLFNCEQNDEIDREQLAKPIIQ